MLEADSDEEDAEKYMPEADDSSSWFRLSSDTRSESQFPFVCDSRPYGSGSATDVSFRGELSLVTGRGSCDEIMGGDRENISNVSKWSGELELVVAEAP